MKFSIIAPHYSESVGVHRFEAFIESILQQSYRDWELLIIHDGPNKREYDKKIIEKYKDIRIKSWETEKRYNDWGHTLRDIGINEANGEYIIICNADNILYKNCLAILHAYSLWPKRNVKVGEKDFIINPDLLIYGVQMMGVFNLINSNGFSRRKGLETQERLILPGWPPNKYRIDAMQLVAKKEIWVKNGGWKYKHEESDGDLIEELTTNSGYMMVPEILGEHW